MGWDGVGWGWRSYWMALSAVSWFCDLPLSARWDPPGCCLQPSSPPAEFTETALWTPAQHSEAEVRPGLLRLSMLWLMRWLNSVRLLRYRLTAWIMHAFLHLCPHKPWRTLGWRMRENINAGSMGFLLHLYCIMHDKMYKVTNNSAITFTSILLRCDLYIFIYLITQKTER